MWDPNIIILDESDVIKNIAQIYIDTQTETTYLIGVKKQNLLINMTESSDRINVPVQIDNVEDVFEERQFKAYLNYNKTALNGITRVATQQQVSLPVGSLRQSHSQVVANTHN